MAETVIDVATDDGTMETFVAHPDSGGPFPVVVLFMDAVGMRDDLYDSARRVAANGYYAALPDLYYRFGRGIHFDPEQLFPGSEEMGRMFATMQQLTDDMVLADTAALLAALEDEPAASAGPTGCVGFCLGGRCVVRAMAALPERFAASSGLHPSFLVTDTPDSPHLSLSTIAGELYLGYGDIDQVAPPASIPPLRAELDRHGVRAEFDVHSDADHGFMFPGFPSYRAEAAERSWERTFDLFGRMLEREAVGAG